MDIIITGEAGCGKTRVMELIIERYRPMYGKAYSPIDVMHVDDVNDPKLGDLIRASRARAIIFDGCVNKQRDMIKAVAAVKYYRKQINADVLAIYVTNGENVCITDIEHPRDNPALPTLEVPIEETKLVTSPEGYLTPKAYADLYNELFTARDLNKYVSSDFPIKSTTARILRDLWIHAAKIVDEAGGEAMICKLAKLASKGGIARAGDTADLIHLRPDQYPELHEFLIELLRKYE